MFLFRPLPTVLFGCALICATVCAADLKQQDIFVAGKDGYHTYRIPSLLVTKKGTVLAFCEGRKTGKGDSGNIDLLLKRSTNNGKTWAKQQIVWDDADNTCGNPCPVQDAETGTIFLLLTHNLGSDHESDIKKSTAQSTRTVWISKSDDDGKTWSAPVNITSDVKDPKWFWYATGPGIGIQLQHGPNKSRLVVPCDHSYVNGTNQFEGGSHVIFSDDHGRTWKLGGAARPKMNECQVVELADKKGTLLLSMRNIPKFEQRAHATSSDGGLTWSAIEFQPQLIDPTCEASILRYSWPKKSEVSRILFSNPASDRRRNMTVRVSYDEGKTWPKSQVLHGKDSAYSCLAALENKKIACLYERGETNAYEKITFASFPLSWLEKKSPR